MLVVKCGLKILKKKEDKKNKQQLKYTGCRVRMPSKNEIKLTNNQLHKKSSSKSPRMLN